MEENRIIVKQNPMFIRIMLFIVSLLFLAFLITGLINASNETEDFLPVVLGISVPIICICVFFAITAKLFIKSEDIYTEKGMVRMRGNKVLYELEWHNVAKIQYNKLSLMSILMFGPTAFLIFQKEPPKDKKQARTFLTYYSMKEVKKIQTIIPIEIQY